MFNYTRDSEYAIISDGANKKIFEDAVRHSAKARTGIRKAFYFIGKMNIKTARDRIIDPQFKTGRTYRYHVRGKVYRHKASAPGQYPANRGRIPGPEFGRLKDSFDFKVTGSRQVQFGSTIYYSKWLEEGTKPKNGKGGMAPRPFLQLTVRNNAAKINKTFYRELRKALKA